MSDIRPDPTLFSPRPAAYRRQRDWQSLRLLVVPDITDNLLVSLVIVPRHGHPRLHPTLRTQNAPWDPSLPVPDDTLYALSQALAAVNQTRR